MRPHDAAQALSAPSSDRKLEDLKDSAFVCQRGGHNITAEFNRRLHVENATFVAQPRDAVNDCDVILVHGWLGEVAIRLTKFLDRFNNHQRLLDYLDDQHRAAHELGLSSKAPLYRSESVYACGEKLAQFIIDNPRPVILIAHSKGCVDALAALLSLQRSGHLNKVAGWLAMQGPFYGCDEAETFFSHSMPLAKLRFKLLGGKIEGVWDMRPSAREEYMAANKSAIDALMRTTPVICFGSWLPPSKENEPLNDGPIVPDSAILPGADYIAKCGIRHAMPVLGWGNPEFDRVAFTKTMMSMLIERIQPAPAGNDVTEHSRKR